MKKLLLLIMVLGLVLSACKQEPGNLISLTGSILNPDGSELFFYHSGTRDTIPVSEEGSISYEKESDKAISGTLVYGRKQISLWLAPGKTLDLTVDVNNWDSSLGFSGDLQTANEYLAAKGLVQMTWGANYLNNFKKEPAVFRASRDSLQGVFTDLLEEYKAKGLDENFVELEKISLTFTQYGDLNNYPRMHRIYGKVEEVNLPDDWYDFVETMDLNDPLVLDVDQAMYFLSSWVNSEGTKLANLGDEGWGKPELLVAKVRFINDRISLPEMKEKLIFDNISQQLDAGPPTGAEEVIAEYLASSTNEDNKKIIEEKNSAWATIAPGQAAPAWTLPDIDGNTMSLADFKGKYVYIDFWATWCGPCKAEFPTYRKLVEDYKGRNIVFVSISVDKDKEAWKKMVQDEAFDWVQLHDGINMNDEYLVRYIPTFVLIDREGKIISPRAPRTSQQELRDLLDSQENL